ncbi:MAG TPA: ATP-binding protein [Rhodanobacteraceae bacterium]|jgi:signal transduction histidine kinase|nr:ATP-binding protein [Rhodanobacteraceae bacterium]
MESLSHSQRVLLKPITTIAAAGLLLLIGVIAMLYQFQSVHAERRRQLTSQAKTLAASVTAAIAFNDHAAAQEYVKALMLDPRVDAVAVYSESGRLVAGAHTPGSAPIQPPSPGNQKRTREANGLPLVSVPARQGTTTVGSVQLRGAGTPWVMQLAKISGVALLTLMGALMLSVVALAQRALGHANADLHRRAEQLATANQHLVAEIEQRARAEEALRQSQKMEAVGQLSGGIAHDFNNVLMVVKTALVLLEKRLAQSYTPIERFEESARERVAAGPEQDAAGPLQVLEEGLELAGQARSRRQQIAHYLETAHGGIEKAAALTGRLLAFARQQPLSPRSLQLDVLVRGMQTLLEHSVGANIEIQYQLHSDWHVLCDANQMENAILNLVINARDAMPEGGEITISTEDIRGEDPHGTDGRVRLRVADTGTGMSEEVRSRALDPFFTTKPVGKGTGLGLSTILGYVMQSNGQLDIESKPGIGTTIDIVLPREVSSVSLEVT